MSIPRFFVKSDVLKFELYRLLCIIALAFDGVLADAEEVINAIKERSPTARVCAVPDLLYPISTSNSGTSDSTGSILRVGGSSFAKPSIMTCSAGRNLSDPMTFVGLCPMAKDIVCPMAVIAPVTVGACTCRPLP